MLDSKFWLVAAAGWGKTRLGVTAAIQKATLGKRTWWIAPTYKMTEVGWRPIRQLAVQIPGCTILRADRVIEFPGGGSVGVRSGDNPDSLRGESLDFVVMDECAFLQEEVWSESIRPALSDRKGRAMFVSTPKGRNWFWRHYRKGLEGNSEWQSWQLPTITNPFIDPGEIEAAQQSIPERTFQQEYLAEFIEDGGNVYRYVRDAATVEQHTGPIESHQYIAGIDWALSHDFTALAIVDATTQQHVYIDRFNGVDYSMQRQRIAAVCQQFGVVSIQAEANAMGKPNNDELRRMGLPVWDFTTTNATKAELVETLASSFERRAIQIVNNPILVGELESYESDRTASGMTRYSAPDGMHDDMAMALMLAWHGASSQPVMEFA